MSKYAPLWEAIGKRAEDSFTLTCAEIEQILGFPIDHAAVGSFRFVSRPFLAIRTMGREK